MLKDNAITSPKPQTVSAVAHRFPMHYFGNISAILGTQLLAVGAFAAQPSESTWAAHNRTLSFSLGFLKQDYTEQDPYGLTANGVLDTERGTLGSAEIGARWQAESIPLQLQATIRRSNGGSDYNGYLQSGSLLTSYSATTGNIMLDLAVRAGLPIAQSANWQWVSFVEYQRHSWQRDLVQYTENFSHSAWLGGLLLQWRQSADSEFGTTPWSVEIEGAAGQMLEANMEAVSLGFNQPLGKRSLWQLGATAGYDLAPQWRISVAASTRRFSYGQSAMQNGMLEPSSTTRQTKLGIGLGWRY